MQFYKVNRYLKHTGEFFDTMVVKSMLDVKATTEQLEKQNGDYFYRLDRIDVPTVDSYGVHS